MEEIFMREEMLLGEDAMARLRAAKVAVFGIGGVGSFVTEALARGGIGHLTLVDGDVVSVSNINRQLIALHSTVGRPKVEVMAERIRDICPETEVETFCCVYGAQNRDLIDFSSFDYIVDAIDMVTSKLILIEEAKKAGTSVICSMGTGNKLDPTRFEVADIAKTSVCPLAKVMRKELKDRRISGVKVVYSKEEARKPRLLQEEGRRAVPGSISFVPSAAGLILAGEVIRQISGVK
ncbi:tRNA threonylcarbamoyladenosine dehydratase [Anaerotignum lactatifermentans]|uniref:tRNA threonylcarbamoyladenosine dehydratase n=1 Tax=Anaerotignum lactatifermentans TaxID=160404 RepID=A0ABS2GCL7_9FIRM|nr:tRNA threonylcarbamoyladenosine dehydratase [Anaerotignum lactatifermentans]MBM6830421.1 tRNA threonylcarbamoyladenosine dehydratase [Anaerotignum lactatifermentans]MBM6878932.1 tRNA threonylcarbamoyladenosine dehydratase [Anaerotignum lactatifermentans]MBM6951980.1 tRNA threonylcarbamoyladenosine dehydratase [Anaerotignum lactatifermentans]